MRKLKLVAMVRRPLAGSEAKEVMIRVYMLGMSVVRGPNVAPLVLERNPGSGARKTKQKNTT